MATVEAMMSELDLFTVPPANYNIENSDYVIYKPLASISDQGPIEFFVPGSSDIYLDLSKTLLQVRVKLLQDDGSNLTDQEKDVGPANLLHAALFNQVDAFFGDTQVNTSTNGYPYLAFFETHLNYGDSAKKSYLSAKMFYKDNPVDSTKMFKPEFQNYSNGMLKRQKRAALSNVIDMIGDLHLDVCRMDKFLLNNVDVRFRFIKSVNDFAIISTITPIKKFKFKILDVTLLIKKIKVNTEVMLAHAMVLEKHNVIYPINRTVLKYFSISSGLTDITRENVFMNKMPSRVVIGLVRTAAFNGDLGLNPFEFSTFNLSYLALTIGNQTFPNPPFTPNYNINEYSREYLSNYTALDLFKRNKGNCITFEEFKEGNALYAFDLTPEEQASADHLSRHKHGNLRLSIKFKSPLIHNVTVIVYAEFESEIIISKDRTVIYNPSGE